MPGPPAAATSTALPVEDADSRRPQVFHLDYSRFSDLDDSVGYWHVEPRTAADGSDISRVTYSAALALRGWWPKAVSGGRRGGSVEFAGCG